MNRQQVYKLIDGERDYQDKKWSKLYDDSKWSASDWLVFIERYVAEAKSRIGTTNPKSPFDSIRKIAGLAIACMEYNETPERESIKKYPVE